MERDSFTEPSHIDYNKLAQALTHYEQIGYTYTEAPWVVDHQSVASTLPEEATATRVQYGDLVGSGEQSFIELLRRGATIAKACCITPCFRIEDTYDELHHRYFMKLELMHTNATRENLNIMINDAQEFLENYIETAVEETEPHTYDIVDKKRHIELGSYGIRSFNNISYIYGTGLALPRLDTVLRITSSL